MPMTREGEAQAGPAPSPSPPEPKARPTPTGGGASSSAGATGSSAKPPPKARPKPPDHPPDWVIPEPPIGYKLFSSSCPDHRGTMFSSSAWMNDNDAFLLSSIQGPAAAGSHISGWAQYLRRITAYELHGFRCVQQQCCNRCRFRQNL